MSEESFESYLDLVPQILSRYNIYRNHPDFEDYYQELSMALFLEFEKVKKEKIHLRSPRGFYARHLDWKLKKIFRQTNRKIKCVQEDKLLDMQPYFESDFQCLEWMMTLNSDLPTRDKLLLSCLIEDRHPIQICRLLHCHPRTLKRRISQLRKKLISRFKS